MSLKNPQRWRPSRSAILSFLLTILFLLSFSRPPRGYVKNKKSPSHFADDAHRNQVSLREARQTLRPFLRFPLGSYSSIITDCCDSVSSPFLREVIATGVN